MIKYYKIQRKILLQYVQFYTIELTRLYGYVSNASNTLIICCLMHFVASPACGIMKRSTALTVSSAAVPLLLPAPASLLFVQYEKVINSGCRFFDVILSIVLRGRRACTNALPFSCGMSRSTIKWESLTHSRLQQHKWIRLLEKITVLKTTGEYKQSSLLMAMHLLLYTRGLWRIHQGTSQYIAMSWVQ